MKKFLFLILAAFTLCFSTNIIAQTGCGLDDVTDGCPSVETTGVPADNGVGNTSFSGLTISGYGCVGSVASFVYGAPVFDPTSGGSANAGGNPLDVFNSCNAASTGIQLCNQGTGNPDFPFDCADVVSFGTDGSSVLAAGGDVAGFDMTLDLCPGVEYILYNDYAVEDLTNGDMTCNTSTFADVSAPYAIGTYTPPGVLDPIDDPSNLSIDGVVVSGDFCDGTGVADITLNWENICDESGVAAGGQIAYGGDYELLINGAIVAGGGADPATISVADSDPCLSGLTGTVNITGLSCATDGSPLSVTLNVIRMADGAMGTVSFVVPATDFDCSACPPAACPEFDAIAIGFLCNGYDICIGYIDVDQDGVGDASGIASTGMTITVDDGGGLGTPIVVNDGDQLLFDSSDDGVDAPDAIGYCVTYVFENLTCDPIPYTINGLTATCPDGTPGFLSGTELTAIDYLGTFFGLPTATAIYPNLVGFITDPVCPTMADGSDAAAGLVEVFPGQDDGAGGLEAVPGAAACLSITGDTPGCETAGGDAATIVQVNPTDDALLTAVLGAPDTYACGFNATADLSFDCPACGVVGACPEFDAIAIGFLCNGYDICIGYIDVDQDGVGDASGIPSTGMTITVDDGGGLGTPIVVNDGDQLLFDSSDDGVDAPDAIGYCVTYVFENLTCDPIPYTINGLTATCPDGTPGFLSGTELTAIDYLGTFFGLPNATAIYPNLVGFITDPVCPTMADGSDAAAGLVEVFPGQDDGAGGLDPVPGAAACLSITGATPACDTAGGDAAVPVQVNPTDDALLTAVLGAPDTYTCGIDVVADLSFDCGACAPSVCNGVVDYPDIEVCNVTGASTAVFTPITCTVTPEVDNGDGTLTVIGFDIYSPDQATGAYAGTLFESATFASSACDPITIGLPDNLSCDAVVFQFEIVTSINTIDQVTGDVLAFADDAECASEIMTVTQHPVLTAALVSEDPANCGTLTAALFDEAGTECAGTQATAECAAAGDGVAPVVSFPASADGCTPAQDVTGAPCMGCAVAVCDISVDITNVVCDQGADPEDPADDTITFDVTVTDNGGTGTTWSSDNGDVGAAYGVAVPVGPLPADGSTFTIIVNDDADMMCTDTKGLVLTDCATSPTDIPTLSEWGLITLALLLMTFGSVKMAVGSVALANTSSRNIPVPGGSKLNLPFDSAIFRKSFMITGLLALVGFAICFAMYATVFMSDIIGVAVAGPIFAYLGHLLYLLETRKEK